MSEDIPDTGNGEGLKGPYNVKQIAELIGMNERLLRTYLDEEDTRTHLEAEGKPPRYPERVLPKFYRLADVAASGTTSPKKLAAAIRAGTDLATLTPTSALVPRSEELLPETRNEELLPALTPQAEAILARIVGEAVKQISSAQPDKLLTLKEAREETGLSSKTIKNLPGVDGEGRYRKWLRSVLNEHLRKLHDSLPG